MIGLLVVDSTLSCHLLPWYNREFNRQNCCFGAIWNDSQLYDNPKTFTGSSLGCFPPHQDLTLSLVSKVFQPLLNPLASNGCLTKNSLQDVGPFKAQFKTESPDMTVAWIIFSDF